MVRQPAKLVPVRDTDLLLELTRGDTGECPLHLADRQDEGPRQGVAQEHRDADRHCREDDDDQLEQHAVGTERRARSRHLGPRLVDQRPHLCLDDV